MLFRAACTPMVMQTRAFSEYFREIDKQALEEFDTGFVHNKHYLRIME